MRKICYHAGKGAQCHFLHFVHETAEKALAELDRRKLAVIITDYKLPGMDGIAFLEKIQKSHPDAVKIMITAYASDSVVRRAKQAGAQQLIPKPFTSETIEACLTRLIDSEGLDVVQEHKMERHQSVGDKLI